MGLWNAQIVFKAATNLEADNSTNTLHFDVPGDNPVGTALDAVTDEIIDFYDRMRGIFGTSVGLTGHEVNWYAMVDPKPRPPRAIYSFDFANVGTGQLPHEVAIVTSFQAAKEAGEVQARRRGRIYLGPLAQGVNGTDGRVTTIHQDAIAASTLLMKDNLEALGVIEWVTYSTVADEMNPVASGWVDNAFDTQRRRGVLSSKRVAWT